MGKRELAGALFNEALLRGRAEEKLIEVGYRQGASGEWRKKYDLVRKEDIDLSGRPLNCE